MNDPNGGLRAGQPAAAVDRLRRIRDACDVGRDLSPADRTWLAGTLTTYVAGAPDGMTLDEAAGVTAAPGSRPWHRREALDRRDEAIRALAREHLGGMGLPEQADEIARLARRYETSAWTRDLHLRRMPAAYRGTKKAHLWAAFMSASVPLSRKQIRRILDMS